MKTCLIALFLCAASLLPQAMAATPADVARKSFQETKIKAEKGDAAAQFALGLMYDVGQGVPKDEAEAVKWIRKAADQEHARAQYNLGVMYADGQGVPKDEAEAVKWYRKAADQGDAKAQSLLGLMYETGLGVPKDKTEAYKWYLLAEAQGDEEAKKAISGIEGEITPAQRAEGQRLARAWKPRKP